MKKQRFVFGPIPSRRLGLSLGVDLLPFKTCPLDCVYCECGATTDHTCVRREYFPLEDVLAEIESALSANPKLDYMTFSGVGEPVLYSRIGEIIRFVKDRWPSVKICLITNSVLLDDPGLQDELRQIDLIMPSLDGSNEHEFSVINRPAPGVTFQKSFDALRDFRRTNRAEMWLEIFIVPGVNDSPESIARFSALVKEIGPDRVQLNSLDRPGVVDWLQIPSRERLEEIQSAMADCGCMVEIISRAKSAPPPIENRDIEQHNGLILKTLESRPCTAEDIAVALGNTDASHVRDHMRRMEKAGLIVSEQGTRGTFYRPAEKS